MTHLTQANGLHDLTTHLLRDEIGRDRDCQARIRAAIALVQTRDRELAAAKTALQDLIREFGGEEG